MMFRRTKRASTAGSITCVVSPAFPRSFRTRSLRIDQRSSAGFPSRCFTSATASPSRTLSIRAGCVTRAPREPFAPELHFHAVPEEDHRREEREPVHPQRAFREEGAANLDGRDRPRLPGPRGEGGGRAALSRPKGSRPPYSPPIRYSYSASTFSSAGMTPSIRWPSSAISPRARANRSRSRVITSMPILSSFSLISVT